MLFGAATCNDGETSRKCCLALLLEMMVKLIEVLFGPDTCDDGETSWKHCLAMLLEMMVKLPGSVVLPCYLQ